MGGEIKVVKKNGPGTLMRLYLVLSTPVDSMDHHCQLDFTQHNAVVSEEIYFFKQNHVLVSTMFMRANAGTACTPWQHESINHVTVDS